MTVCLLFIEEKNNIMFKEMEKSLYWHILFIEKMEKPLKRKLKIKINLLKKIKRNKLKS
jgi:hypothetical protein